MNGFGGIFHGYSDLDEVGTQAVPLHGLGSTVAPKKRQLAETKKPIAPVKAPVKQPGTLEFNEKSGSNSRLNQLANRSFSPSPGSVTRDRTTQKRGPAFDPTAEPSKKAASQSLAKTGASAPQAKRGDVPKPPSKVPLQKMNDRLHDKGQWQLPDKLIGPRGQVANMRDMTPEARKKAEPEFLKHNTVIGGGHWEPREQANVRRRGGVTPEGKTNSPDDVKKMFAQLNAGIATKPPKQDYVDTKKGKVALHDRVDPSFLGRGGKGNAPLKPSGPLGSDKKVTYPAGPLRLKTPAGAARPVAPVPTKMATPAPKPKKSAKSGGGGGSGHRRGEYLHPHNIPTMLSPSGSGGRALKSLVRSALAVTGVTPVAQTLEDQVEDHRFGALTHSYGGR